MSNTETTDGREQTDVSRREVLQKSGQGAVLLPTLGSSEEVLGRGDTQKSITILAEGDSSARSVDVSLSWYNHTKTARKAKRQIKQKLGTENDVINIGVGVGDRRIGGLLSHNIVVGVDGSLSGATIPESIDGVQIRVEDIEEPDPTGHQTGSLSTGCTPNYDGDCYTDYDDEIYGGQACKTEVVNNDSIETYATTACRVYRGGEKYLMMCRHQYIEDLKNCKDIDITGGNFYRQKRESNQSCGSLHKKFGEVSFHYRDSDAAFVTNGSVSESEDDGPVNVLPIVYDIAGESNGGIVGRVTGDGLDYLKSSNTILEKRGRKNCLTEGRIKKKGIDQLFDCGPFGYLRAMVRTTTKQGPRDSGGPVYFHDSDDKLYFAHLAGQEMTDGSDDTRGTSGNYLNNSHNITFGGNPYSG